MESRGEREEIIFNLFREEEILNGYFHLVQKKIHGKNNTVGIKDMHIKYAEYMDVPIMIHYCPDYYDNGEPLSKANWKDQDSAMIIYPKDFYNLKHNSVSYERDKEGNVILDENNTPKVKSFHKSYQSKVSWINENFSKYEVWHYPWYPDYKSDTGIIDKSSNIDDLKIV